MTTKACCEILKALRDEPMNRHDLAKHMGLQVSTIHHHLQLIEDYGLIERLIGPKKATGPNCNLYTVSKRWRNN